MYRKITTTCLTIYNINIPVPIDRKVHSTIKLSSQTQTLDIMQINSSDRNISHPQEL
jgi:type IV secretory pathway component VirB8